jgi:hypothetical protein
VFHSVLSPCNKAHTTLPIYIKWIILRTTVSPC